MTSEQLGVPEVAAGRKRKRLGDVLELGDILGDPMDSATRYARVVGIRKDDCRPMERIIMRKYLPDDPDGRPTGEYRTTWLVVPWDGP